MLYHKDVFMPAGFLSILPNKEMRVVYSQHATAQMWAKYSTHAEDLPAVINPSQAKLVEVETDGQGEPFKFVIRLPFDNRCDLCLPVEIRGNVLFARTAWLNCRDDKHSTLRVSLYARA